MADPPNDVPEVRGDRITFRAEYERELGQWLRKRLGWLCIAYATFQILGTLALVGSLALFEAEPEDAEPRTQGVAAPGEATPRVLTPLDAVVEFTRGVQRGVQAGSPQSDRPPPIGRMMDRWFDEKILPIAERPPAPAPLAPADPGTSTQDGTGAGTRTGADDAAESPPASEGGKEEGPGADPLRLVPWWVWVLLSVPSLATIAWFGLVLRPRLYTRNELVAAATRMIVILGFLTFTVESAILIADQDAAVAPVLSIWFWHLTASLVLPWTWRESLRPIVPLFLAWILLRAGLAAADGSWIAFVLAVGFAPLLFLPAIALCYVRLRWHRNRFKSGFVGRRFLAMRREFLQARAVHESLFPAPIETPWFRFGFAYRPAADIGGDFVHAWIDDDERLWVALIDVTGHGLASAMTVARLSGEVDRIVAEHPGLGPGELLRRLNTYCVLTLAQQGIHATAAAAWIDPSSGRVRYANAGHPPMFVRRAAASVDRLDGTTMLLGVVEAAEFGEAEGESSLGQGDSLVLITDGLYEAFDARGRQFGLARVDAALRRDPPPANWTPHLIDLVQEWRGRIADDDLLAVSIRRMGGASLPRPGDGSV